MKCLVVYTSRSGNTEKLARAIAAALGPECVLAAAARICYTLLITDIHLHHERSPPC